MRLCEEGHDEVCYEVVDCPVCEEVARLDQEIRDLNDEIDRLREKKGEK